MLPESRLYSFLDSENNFAIYFLEGQKLFHDLVLLTNISGEGLHYYRETVLAAQQLINFLKPGENLGFYIDSTEPYIRFKMETNSLGNTRILMIPAMDFFPEAITGFCRLVKVTESQKTPYSTTIELNKTPTKDLVNKVLSESYQVASEILISDTTDQSLMITILPENPDKASEQLSMKKYTEMKSSFFNEIFAQNLTDQDEIVKRFEKEKFLYLGSKQVKFFCPCTKERMMINLLNLQNHDLTEIFHQDKKIEIKCDYCNKIYEITYDELLKLN